MTWGVMSGIASRQTSAASKQTAGCLLHCAQLHGVRLPHLRQGNTAAATGQDRYCRKSPSRNVSVLSQSSRIGATPYSVMHARTTLSSQTRPVGLSAFWCKTASYASWGVPEVSVRRTKVARSTVQLLF